MPTLKSPMMSVSSEANVPKPRRSGWQRFVPRFSLRTFILTTTILTAVIAIWTKNSLDQKRAIERLVSFEGKNFRVNIYYDNFKRTGQHYSSMSETNMFARLLGPDFAHRILFVELITLNGHPSLQETPEYQRINEENKTKFYAAMKILSECKNVSHVRLSFADRPIVDTEIVDDLNRMRSVTNLTLDGGYEYQHDWSALSKLENIRMFHLRDTSLYYLLHDLNDMKGLVHLRTLRIGTHDFSDSSGRLNRVFFQTIAEQFPELTELNIYGFSTLNVADLAPLNQHPSLKKLSLSPITSLGIYRNSHPLLKLEEVQAILPKLEIGLGEDHGMLNPID